jgi:hypothetical protein
MSRPRLDIVQTTLMTPNRSLLRLKIIRHHLYLRVPAIPIQLDLS